MELNVGARASAVGLRMGTWLEDECLPRRESGVIVDYVGHSLAWGESGVNVEYVGYSLARRGSGVNVDYGGNNLAWGLQLGSERKEPNVGGQASAVGLRMGVCLGGRAV